MRAFFAVTLGSALTFGAGLAAADEKAPSWDSVFSLAGAPKGVHLTASYLDSKGRSHALELWRDGDSRLRRRTDDKLDLFAEKTKGGDYTFRLIDLAAKRLFEVSRTNLARIGVFPDFPALAGILARPKVAHSLHRDGRPIERTRVGDCGWVRLEVKGGGSKDICWSDRFKVPLLIKAPTPPQAGSQASPGPGGPTTIHFEVKQIEAKVPSTEVFKVPQRGLHVIRADQDIDPSSDL